MTGHEVARSAENAETRGGVVISFTMPSDGERWHWPVEGADAIDAFVEILDRANIPCSVRPMVAL